MWSRRMFRAWMHAKAVIQLENEGKRPCFCCGRYYECDCFSFLGRCAEHDPKLTLKR